MEQAAGIAVRECWRALRDNKSLETITFALRGKDAVALYEAEIARLEA
jgi:hypothetical protein